MDKLDKLIEEALQNEDHEILSETAELGYFAASRDLFRGKTAWVSWVIMIVQTVMFVVSVWMAFKFFAATDVLVAVKWGISAAVVMLAGFNLKLSLMPQLQADRIMRELKRVELMLAARSGK